MPGPDRDPVHGQHAFRRHDLRRVVVPPGTGPGDHDQQIAPGSGRVHGGRDPGRVVRLDRQHPRLAAGLPRLLREHQRVRVEYLARAGLGDPHQVLGVHAVVVLQEAAHPHSRSDLVHAHADALAAQVRRPADARARRALSCELPGSTALA